MFSVLKDVTENTRGLPQTVNRFWFGKWRQSLYGALAFCVIACFASEEDSSDQATPALRTGILSDQSSRSEMQFGHVSAIAEAEDSTVAILDMGRQSLDLFKHGERRFSVSTGSLFDDSLVRLCCLAFDNKGHLWLVDRRNRVYKEYLVRDHDLREVAKIVTVHTISGLASRVFWDPHGNVIQYVDSVSSDGRVSVIKEVLRPSGVIDSREVLGRSTLERLGAHVVRLPNGSITVLAKPFGPTFLRAFGTNGETAEAISGDYKIAWLDDSRRPITTIEQNVLGPPITRSERRRVEADLESMAAKYGIGRHDPFMAVPDRTPPIESIGFDLDGNLIVKRASRSTGESTFDAYNRAGNQIASFQLPEEIADGPLAMRGRTVFGVARGAEATQRVFLFRVPEITIRGR